MSFNGKDEPPRLFSKNKLILEANDEMWLHPCLNPNHSNINILRNILIKCGTYKEGD